MKVAQVLLKFTVSKNFIQSVNRIKPNQKINKNFNFHQLTSKQSYHFTSIKQQQQVFSQQKEEDMYKKQLQYRATQDFSVFESAVKNSTGLLDQMTIFKIFKVMEASPFNFDTYNKFYETVDNMFKKKSDNMLLLLGSIKKRVGDKYKYEKSYENALKSYEQALDILQNSMVPPLLPYYSIYREYGLLHHILGQEVKAKQILTESVDILDEFVSHSDDNVSTNDFAKKQAAAYNALAKIDPQNKNKWIDKANESWKVFADQRFKELQYAKTVALNVQKLLKQDKQKGDSYYNYNLYKFQNKQFKQILKKAKEQAGL